MINFRYHVVSLTAVFLALAVGLVLGSTVLNGPMLDALENRVNNLGRDNSQLREQVSFLEDEVDREQEFANEAAPLLLDGTLAGRSVLVLTLPGGAEYAPGVIQMLELAGADLTGEVVLTDRFTHPQHRLGELLDLSSRALPPSVDGDSLPANADGVETSAALLSRVLLNDPPGLVAENIDPPDDPTGENPGPSAVPDQDRRRVLSAYATLEFLEQPVEVTGAADIVVMVTGLPEAESDADERNQALLVTVAEFAAAGPVAVAGSGVAGDGNVVAEVRGDPTLADEISTVDNASAPQGQVAAGLATAERLAGGVGHYGNGAGAQGRLPALASQ